MSALTRAGTGRWSGKMNVAAIRNESGEPKELGGVLESEKEISRDQVVTK